MPAEQVSFICNAELIQHANKTNNAELIQHANKTNGFNLIKTSKQNCLSTDTLNKTQLNPGLIAEIKQS